MNSIIWPNGNLTEGEESDTSPRPLVGSPLDAVDLTLIYWRRQNTKTRSVSKSDQDVFIVTGRQFRTHSTEYAWSIAVPP